MKRLSILLTLVAFIGFTAFAQQPIRHDLTPQTLKAVKEMKNKNSFNQLRDDTLVYFNSQPCDSFVTAYLLATNLSSGFLLGTNFLVDSADAEKYEGIPGNKIVGTFLWFGFATSTASTQKIHVKAWDANGPGASPGAVLGTVDVTQQSIAADVTAGNLTLVYFPTPINMPAGGNFFVGYGMDYKKKQGKPTYDSTRALALLQSVIFNSDYTALNTCSDDSIENTAWVLTSKTTQDGAWHPIWDLWTVGGAPIATRSQIYPIVTAPSGCTVTISPTSSTICNKKSVNLTATSSSGTGTWTWAPSTGLNVTTGATVSAKPATTTTYTATNSGGCSGTVTVTVNPIPTTAITQDACVAGHKLLHANANPSTGVTYKWFLNGVKINGATASTYNASTSGSYKVTVTITATTCKKTSKVVTVTISCKMSDVEVSTFDASAYPNPFTKSVSVNIATPSKEAATVQIMDFSGRTLNTFNDVDVSVPFEINSDLTAGVYFIKVVQGSNEKMIKVVKSE